MSLLPRTISTMSLSMAHPAPIKTTARSDRMDHEDGGRCGCDAGEKPPVMIAVMGVTGAGKSTFISTLTERDVEIGHDLTSCTEMVTEYNFMVDNNCVHLIDTPGFDDTNKSDTETLQTISQYLADSYREHIKLSAIIYIHPISNSRMAGSTLRNFSMFRKLCGDDPLKNIILATNFWEVLEDERVGLHREQELRDNFWKPLADRGSRIVRFRRKDRAGALRIIESYLSHDPIALQIQTEIVDEKKKLIETEAGYSLNQDLIRVQQEHSATLLKIQAEFEDSLARKDEVLMEILEVERNDTMEKLNAMKEAQKKLLEDSLHVQRRLEKKVEEQGAVVAEQGRLQQDSEQKLRSLESRLDEVLMMQQQNDRDGSATPAPCIGRTSLYRDGDQVPTSSAYLELDVWDPKQVGVQRSDGRKEVELGDIAGGVTNKRRTEIALAEIVKQEEDLKDNLRAATQKRIEAEETEREMGEYLRIAVDARIALEQAESEIDAKIQTIIEARKRLERELSASGFDKILLEKRIENQVDGPEVTTTSTTRSTGDQAEVSVIGKNDIGEATSTSLINVHGPSFRNAMGEIKGALRYKFRKLHV